MAACARHGPSMTTHLTARSHLPAAVRGTRYEPMGCLHLNSVVKMPAKGNHMPLPLNPMPGTIVIRDFSGFVVPEMVKRRPAIVVSPRLRGRGNLCTIVPLSTTPPSKEQNYHYLLELDPPLPKPNGAESCWVKGDMLYTVSYGRLNLPHERDIAGKRVYITRVISSDDLRNIRQCILVGLGMEALTPFGQRRTV
jgi:mRNA interferase MazF